MLFRIVTWITFVKIKARFIAGCISYLHFYVKMDFSAKIRKIISNVFDLNKCYPRYDAEQHLRDFSHQLDTLGSANVGDIVISELYNLKNNFINVLKSS